MDKLTLDFENDVLIWDTDGQQGTEIYKGLKEKKKEVLDVLGYEEIDFAPELNDFNDFINGKISQEELRERLKSHKND